MKHVLAGIDLGGTNIKAALAGEDGSILIERAVATESQRGPENVLERIGSLVTQLAEETNSSIRSLGMGVPGLVDVATGVTKFLPNLPTQWRDVPVAERLSNTLACPVRLLNDVRTATLAELRFGHGRDRSQVTLAFFAIGTGIGGGVAIDGKLRLGPMGAAGELGHQTILPDGPWCGCGNRGCLESLASGPAIAAEGIRLMRMGLAPKLYEIVGGSADRVTTREMALAAAEDEPIRNAIHRAASFIGIAATNVVMTLHPDLIVLGGGVAEMGEPLLVAVRQVIRERAGMFPADSVQVVQSRLGEKAGMMGAIALAARPPTDAH